MAFLGDFANSSVSPSTCVRDFSDGCRGKADEKSDIESNREHFVITNSSLRLQNVRVEPERHERRHERGVQLYVAHHQVRARRQGLRRWQRRHRSWRLRVDGGLRAAALVAVHQQLSQRPADLAGIQVLLLAEAELTCFVVHELDARVQKASPNPHCGVRPCHPRRRLRRLADGAKSQSAAACQTTLPVIVSIRIQGSRPNEPANFADVGETVGVSAEVRDDETPVSQLQFVWSSSVGTFSGNGPTVTWQAPAATAAPANVALRLEVVERYGPASAPTAFEHRVSSSADVRLHDSTREVGDMARQFLLDFSDSSIRDVDYIMRNFEPGCYGTADERQQVQDNRADFRIVDPLSVRRRRLWVSAACARSGADREMRARACR